MSSDDEISVSIIKIIGTAVLAIFVIFLLFCMFAWPFKKAPADKIALSYGGGPFEGAKFQGITEPGSGLKFNGWFDKWYEYPVTQRNYIVSKDIAEGDKKQEDFIEAPSSDKVPIQWELSVYFKLNTNIIRQFHEIVGLKYQAWTDAGWNAMLQQTFRQQVEAAIQRESRKHTSDEYQSSSAVLEQVRINFASNLKDSINTVLGAQYFCGPNFDRNKQDCPDFEVVIKRATLPDSVVQSYTDQKNSANAIVTATNQATAAQEVAKGQKLAQSALQGIYTDPNYIEYLRALALQKCAENGNCTIISAPTGTGVVVAPK